jgi:amino acid adenylation domain-containing protein
MMKTDSTFELVCRLKRQGIQLRAQNDKLQIDAPKGIVDASLLEELSRRKTEILHFLAGSAGFTNNAIMPLRRISRDRSFPLSFSQERLWFLHQLEPESVAYNMPRRVRLKVRLEEKTIEHALVALALRHEILRTTFKFVNGKIEQVIAPEPTISLQKVDLRELPAKVREAEAIRLSDEQSRKPFDLGSGPIIKMVLYQLDENDHILYSNMHHIISDYWSFGIIDREFVELYRAFATGTQPQLPELTVQYADFAYCQREWFHGEVLETHLAYWKEKLGGELATLSLPSDRARPPVQTHRGSQESLVLPQGLVETLRNLSRRKGVSLFMLFLAVFKILLFRYAGQEDIIVGTPIAGRNRIEIEGLIGFFINTIVMRTDLSGDPAFSELLERVRETALGAYDHQEMPFEKLVEELSPQRDLSRTPLFQIFFNHIQVNDSAGGLPGLTVETVDGNESESKFDITMYIWERSDSIILTAHYNTDLFDADRIVTMLDQYQHLLEQVVADPEERIGRYTLLAPSREKHLPDPTAALEPRWVVPVHTRFSEQAIHAPERTAIVDARGSWSYGELERAGNQLAGHLNSRGIRPGDAVAILAHRSAGLVLALLGVLKAGAAFLILDSNYPAVRLMKIIEESRPAGLLHMEAAGPVAHELDSFVAASNFKCCLTLPRSKEAAEAFLQGLPSTVPANEVAPDEIAYIAFTSGSTGRPKGIVSTHRPLSHFLEWHCRTFDLDERDRFSMLSGLSHDPLLRDIFTPFWIGAALCIPDPDEMLIPYKLRSWMRTHQITVAHITPALGQILTESAGEAGAHVERLSALRYVFFGGDTLTQSHVRRINELAPEVQCVNFYGSTETPQAISYHVVDPEGVDRFRERMPVGKGIDGVQLLVLNSAGRMTGVGELGEIHVRTPYLSVGYLQDDLATSEKFILNPCTSDKKDIVYRTGDLGHYLFDGSVMFSGRIDSQVSIRGFRVELKEIEAILLFHSDIKDCAVVACDRESGDKYLVAYVVSNDAHKFDPVYLRERMRTHLPDYMIPAAFVRLNELPLTQNGKVDVKRLLSSEHIRTQVTPVSNQPLTNMEKIISDIWQKELGLDHISVHDNFFEIGGHSLLSIQVISQLEKRTGLRINPRELVYQTLGQLSASLDQQVRDFAPNAKQDRKMSVLKTIKRKIFGYQSGS